MFLKKEYFFIVLMMLVGFSCQQKIQDYNPSHEKVNTVLNDWHNAAAEADFERYFNHFDSESAIFMGTDATERWTVPEFKAYARPYFEAGDAWDFVAVQRHVYFSPNGKTAWFDEELDTPNLGPARGSGILLKRDDGWKIAHYNLTVPIPNSIVYDVVEQVEKALEDTTATE